MSWIKIKQALLALANAHPQVNSFGTGDPLAIGTDNTINLRTPSRERIVYPLVFADVQSALQIYSTLDFVTIQLVLKRLQFQSRRQELEEKYNKNIAVSQLIELKNSGKWDNLNWSNKYPGIS